MSHQQSSFANRTGPFRNRVHRKPRVLSIENLEMRRMMAADICPIVEDPTFIGPMPCELGPERPLQSAPKETVHQPPVLSMSSVSVREQDGLAELTLELSHPSNEQIDVRFQTVDGCGTASAGLDYIPSNGAVRFEAGQTEQHVWIQIASDNVEERDENLLIQFDGGRSVQPVMAPGGNHATVTIVGDNSLRVQDEVQVGSPKSAAADRIAKLASANDAAPIGSQSRGEGESPNQPRGRMGEQYFEQRLDLNRDGQLTIADGLHSIMVYRNSQNAILTDEAIAEMDVNLDGQFRLDDVFDVIDAVRQDFQSSRAVLAESRIAGQLF